MTESLRTKLTGDILLHPVQHGDSWFTGLTALKAGLISRLRPEIIPVEPQDRLGTKKNRTRCISYPDGLVIESRWSGHVL